MTRPVRPTAIRAARARRLAGRSLATLALGGVILAGCEGVFTPRVELPYVTWATIAPGQSFTCGLDTDGTAYCWGASEWGQAGEAREACPVFESEFPCNLRPTPLEGGLRFDRLASGGTHACAVTADGTAFCWGAHTRGQLGASPPDTCAPWYLDGESAPCGAAPVRVATDVRFAGVVAGSVHTCGLAADGAAYCWGGNDAGQLGTGDLADSAIPAPAAPGLRFRQLAAGGASTCGLTHDGLVYCWGAVWIERSEDGWEFSRVTPLADPVPGGDPFRAIATGEFSRCGLGDDDRLRCWGANRMGEFGNGESTGSRVPIPGGGGRVFRSFTVGLGTACGIGEDGAAHCWGHNAFGTVGDGTRRDRTAPVPVAGGHRFVAIGAGAGSHACAVTASGEGYCWGLGSLGQLGWGGRLTAPRPIRVGPATP